MEELIKPAFGVGLIGLGIWFVQHYRGSQERLRRAQYWPSVRGEVIESRVRQRRRGRHRSYEARIRYRYEIANREYTSEKVCIGGQLAGGRGRAAGRCRKYPEGSTPAVFYDPSRPEVACLERVHEGRWLELAGAAFAVIAGLALLLRHFGNPGS